MLAGIAAAVVPLVLHLLNRLRFRNVEWGAMMFLHSDEAPPQALSWVRPLSLMLLRMATVALLALALARPTLATRTLATDAVPLPQTLSIILLNRAPAMSYEQQGHSRFSLAKQAAQTLLAALPAQERCAVLTLGDGGANVDPRLSLPTTDHDQLRGLVEGLSIGWGAADVREGLGRAAAAALAVHAHWLRVFVITDHRGSPWEAMTHDNCVRLLRLLGQTALDVDVVQVGDQVAQNLAVSRVSVLSEPVIRGRATNISVTLRNYGDATYTSLPLKIRIDDQLADNTAIDVPPFAEQVYQTSVVFPSAGQQSLTASITPSAMLFDDQATCAVMVRPALSTLLIDGGVAQGTASPQTGFVRLALAPFAAARRLGNNLADVTTLGVDDPNWSHDLQRYAVVMLLDVPTLPHDQLQDLESFVYSGGGLLLAPGDQCAALPPSDSLYAGHVTLVPATLAGATGADLAKPTGLNLGGGTSPPATIRRFFRASRTSSDATVVTRFDNQQPFSIRQPYGQGRVMLITTPMDDQWGTLVLAPTFLPWLESTALDLAGGGVLPLNVDARDPLLARFDAHVDAHAQVIRPDGSRADLTLVQRELFTNGRFTDTQLPGQYTIVARAPDATQTLHYVVRAPPELSDLQLLTDDRWQIVTSAIHCQGVGDTPDELGAAARQTPPRLELWPALVLAAALCGLGELLLGFWMTRNVASRPAFPLATRFRLVAETRA